MDKITTTDLQDMVSHWLGTPVNGYLGSSYGSIVPDMLQQPQKTGLADAVLNKLRVDIPLVGALPASQLDMYSVDDGPDQRKMFIVASGAVVDAGNTAI